MKKQELISPLKAIKAFCCIWRDKTATGAGLNGQRAENGGQVSLAA